VFVLLLGEPKNSELSYKASFQSKTLKKSWDFSIPVMSFRTLKTLKCFFDSEEKTFPE
jgi:hypothetical protein